MSSSKTDAAVLKAPAAEPPTSTVADFKNPPSLFVAVAVTIAVCLPVETLVISLRIYTKALLKHSLGKDDCDVLMHSVLMVAY